MVAVHIGHRLPAQQRVEQVAIVAVPTEATIIRTTTKQTTTTTPTTTTPTTTTPTTTTPTTTTPTTTTPTTTTTATTTSTTTTPITTTPTTTTSTTTTPTTTTPTTTTLISTTPTKTTPTSTTSSTTTRRAATSANNTKSICRARFTVQRNSHGGGHGQQLPDVHTLERCKAACVVHRPCVAVDWELASNTCWLYDDPHDRHLFVGYVGINHYDVVARCPDDKAINQSKIAITPHNIVNPANPPLKNVGVLKSEASSSHQSNKSRKHFQSDSIVLLVCTAVFVLALLISAFFLRRHYSLPTNAGASESFVEERRKLLADDNTDPNKKSDGQAQVAHHVKDATPQPW